MYIIRILGLGTLIFSNILIASENILSSDESVKYKSIYTGYFIEKKCRFGAEQMLKDFELSLKVIKKGLDNRGVDQNEIEILRKKSEKIANLEQFSECKETAKNVASISFRTSWAWSNAIIEKSKQAANQNVKKGMPIGKWLSNLRPAMGKHLCAAKSPFLAAYKEPINTCMETVDSLFTDCTINEPKFEIPSYVTSPSQANGLGNIVAECISAHYLGGAALEAFHMFQNHKNDG